MNELTDKNGTPVKVTAGPNNYTISYDDAGAVGEVAYVDHGDARIFYSTEVADGYEGRGLASILVSEAVAGAVAEQRTVVGTCSMVAHWLSKHGDDVDWRPATAEDYQAVGK